MADVTVKVVKPFHPRAGLLAELEVHFHGGPLAGLKLINFQVRQDKHGGVFITIPGKAWGMGADRRYFDYLRPIARDVDEARAVRDGVLAWLREEWKRNTENDDD